jgi:natural product biosynthesis luciferase-like monooxygenase protein/amino acid adenylation domain-containing protein
MKIGLIFFASGENGSRSDKYRLVMEGARFADANGFSSVWIPERHFTPDGCLFPNPAVIQAAIARETSRVSLRAGSVVLPLHHPARVAEEWAVVDNLSGGRVGLSFASGWHPDDFIFAPASYRQRNQVMYEGIETVKRLWRGETLAFPGGHGGESRIRIYPTPIQPELPIWVTAAGNPETFAAAGKMGAHLLTHMFNQGVDELASKVAVYRQARADAGFDPDAGEVSVMLHTFVSAGYDAAGAAVRDAFCGYLRGATYLLKAIAASREVPVDLDALSGRDMEEYLEIVFNRLVSTKRVLFGTPESTAPFVAELAAAGVTEVACQMDFGMDTDDVLASLPDLEALRRISETGSFRDTVRLQQTAGGSVAPAAPRPTVQPAASSAPAPAAVQPAAISAPAPAAVQPAAISASAPAVQPEVLELSDARARCPVERDAARLAAEVPRVDGAGEWSPATKLWQGSGEVLARVEAGGEGAASSPLPPELLDAAFRLIPAALAEPVRARLGDARFVPLAVESVQLHQAPAGPLWLYAATRAGEDAASLTGDVRAFADDGTLSFVLEGVRLDRVAAGEAPREQRFLQRIHRIRWQAGEPARDGAPAGPGTWVIATDRGGFGAAAARALEERGAHCVCVEAADSAGVSAAIAACPMPLQGVISFGALDVPALRVADAAPLRAGQEAACGGVLDAARRLEALRATGAGLWVVTRGAQRVGGEEHPLAATQATLWGLGRALRQEHPGSWGGLVDLDPAAGAEPSARELAAHLLARDGEDETAFRGGVRHVPRLELAAGAGEARPLAPRADAAYLVTGGLGELGLLAARRLAERGARHVVLLGRNALPARGEWDAVPPASRVGQRIAGVRAIEAAGAATYLVAADVADEAQTTAALDELAARGVPAVRGVVHAAGVFELSPARELDAASLWTTLRPKVQGAWVLHRVFADTPLDFFVLYSSWASFASPVAQELGAYAAANAFLDALAHRRRAEGKPATSIGWGDWAEAGVRSRHARGRGAWTLSNADALDAFEHLAGSGEAHAAVLPVDWPAWLALFPAAAAHPFFAELRGGEPEAAAPAPAPAAGGAREALLAAAPAERAELLARHLAARVAAVLGTSAERVDVDTPLLHMGLDSLMSVELRNRVEKELGVLLPLAALFDGPTVRSLAATLLPQLAAAAPEIVAAAAGERGPVPLSQGQKSLWFVQRVDPAGTALNVPLVTRVMSEVDAAAMGRAFRALLQRHPALRSRMWMEDGEPVQEAMDPFQPSWRVADSAGWSGAAVDEAVQHMVHTPFDLEGGELVRGALFPRPGGEWILAIVVHHIATDFWSNSLLFTELVALYEAERTGTPAALAAPEGDFAGYVRWHERMLAGPEGERMWGYWKERLSGTLPILALPTDHPRPPLQTYSGASHHFRMSAELTAELNALARERGTTLFVLLLAAYHALLHRYSGQEEIMVATPVAGRSRAEFEPLVGYFMNPVIIRAGVDPRAPFTALMEDVREKVVEALDHQDFPAHLLVERLRPVRDPSHSLLFQTMFVYNRTQRSADAGGVLLGDASRTLQSGSLTLQPLEVEEKTSFCDLTLYLGETENGVGGRICYNPDLFTPATMSRLGDHYEMLLRGAVAAPATRVGELPLVTAPEEGALLGEWAHGEPGAGAPLAHEAFTRMAAEAPERTAVVCGAERMTYGELDLRSSRLANRLRALGVTTDVPVALCLERSVELMVGIMGILKAGGAYVPLDPAYPAERLVYMLEDSGAPVVVTRRRHVEDLSDGGRRFLCVDSDRAAIDAAGDEAPPARAHAESLAYVIYTSGSTGRPKGTMIPHGALANHTASAADSYGVDAADRVLQFASASFDASVEEIFPALARGASLVMHPEGAVRSVPELFQLCEAEGVTLLDLPTAYWHALVAALEEGAALPAAVRLVIIGGERAQAGPVAAWHRHVAPGVRLVNSYGPTEATVVTTRHEPAPGDAGEVPIGRAIHGVSTYVLNRFLQPVPAGVPGELYVGGAGLARGYLGQPALTAEKLVPDPFGGEPGARLYATGDRARFRADGSLEFVGRVDQQVKIRGFRVEPGEVEAMLQTHPDVAECAVAAREDAPGQVRLVAYVAAAHPGLTARDLREFAREILPDYMVPAAFVLMEALPLTPTGKVDRGALPSPEASSAPAAGFVAPRDAVEELLAGIWAAVLRHPRVGIADNFFELGGDSILALQVISRAHRAGLQVNPRDVFQHQTIEALAGALASQSPPPAGSGLPDLSARELVLAGAPTL